MTTIFCALILSAVFEPPEPTSGSIRLDLYVRDTTIPADTASAVVIQITNRSGAPIRLTPFVERRAFSRDGAGKRLPARPLATSMTTKPASPSATQNAEADSEVEWRGLPRLVLEIESDATEQLIEEFVPAVRSIPIEVTSVERRTPAFKAVLLPRWCLRGTQIRVKAIVEGIDGSPICESNLHVLKIES